MPTTSAASTRSASALILIMAILTLTVVLAFGTLAFVSDQRNYARTKHTDSLIRQAMLSGRAHAQRVLELSYLAARQHRLPTAIDLPAAPNQDWIDSQRWRFDFAELPSGSGPSYAERWPKSGDPGYATPALLQARRQSLADGDWGTFNAVDLWRFEPGIASPIVRATSSTPHGHDDGWCSHDGTGRWFTVSWLDRDLRPVTQAKASYQLRYAVAAIDLAGLLLGNKARYQHLTTGTRLAATYLRSASDESTKVAGTPLGSDRWAATGIRDDVPVSGSLSPCPQTDLPLGRDDDTIGINRLRYNTWRPIPADHVFSAHMLLKIGCDLDDSGPNSWSDGTLSPPTYKKVGGKDRAYVERSSGNLPDSWRSQGYKSVTQKYWQFSRRFGDFLPYDQNPHPVTSPDANGTALSTNNGSAKANDPTWGTRLTNVPSTVNRHPIALLSALHNDFSDNPLSSPKFQFPGDPYTYALAQNARRHGDVWNQIDMPNWLALGQGLRLHKILSGNSIVNGLPALPTAADGMIQCWSPFGSTMGRFTDRAGGTFGNGSDNPATNAVDPDPAYLRQKNDWEMLYQWTPDANTAPRQVLIDVLRLAIPQDTSGHSAESSIQADRDAYTASLATIATSIAAGRPYTTGITLVAAAVGWHSDPATQRMLQSCIFGGDGSALLPSDLGVGAGPRAEFTVLEWNTSNPAKPYVVISGRHLRRFWSGSITGNTEAIYRLRGWSTGNATSTADLWVDQGSGGGAQYVDWVAGTTTVNASGSATRIWLSASSLANIDPGATRAIVHYPGVTLSVGVSRWFRVAIRAELRDIDVPESSRDQSMDMVLHIDPDNSGNADKSTGLWDTDVPYCDLENRLQWRTTDGSIIW
jgi:hypothetical protein